MNHLDNPIITLNNGIKLKESDKKVTDNFSDPENETDSYNENKDIKNL